MCNFNSDLQVLYLILIEKVVKIIFKSMARSISIGTGNNF